MKVIHLAILAATLAATAPASAQQTITIRPSPTAGGQALNVNDICKNLNTYESLKVTVPLLLGLNDRQAQSWKAVEGALADAKRPVESGCGKLSTMPAGMAATAKAARLEVVLSSTLEALRRVRPSFDRFYGTLSAEQRTKIDKMFQNSPL
jgi:hypothetical protein